MGLFSKLLEQAGKEIGLDKVAKSVTEAAEKLAEGLQTSGAPEAPKAAAAAEPEESGFSWGPEMPAEENQYNYPGSYSDYFNDIFTTEYAEYGLDYVKEPNWRSEHFTFWDGGRRVLVVELLSEKSNARRIRNFCRAEGTPYLRFYYDHDGWWNTRAYVKSRVDAALGK
ncbi:MAG: hypothetical protein IKX89_02150 [Firmicutes bacterium]|nr:hypothetical protein [Bacillota bacterium]